MFYCLFAVQRSFEEGCLYKYAKRRNICFGGVCTIGVSGSPLSLYAMGFLPSILGLLNRGKWSDCLKCQYDACLLAYQLFSPVLAFSLILRQTQNDYQNDCRASLNNLVKYSNHVEVKGGQERLRFLLTHSKVNIHIFFPL